MKKRSIYAQAIIAGLLLFVVVSCSKWDDFKKYTKTGEIVYTGKMDSVKVYSGRLRVRIVGILPPDPNIVKCVISWNSGGDSVVFPISKGGEPMTFDQTFKVGEGVQNFDIRTFDAKGNSSVSVYVTGTAYGPRYASGLTNRPLSKYELYAGNLTATIDFGDMDLTSGVFASEIQYQDQEGRKHTVHIPIDSTEIKLSDYKVGTDFKYRTLFLPDSTSVDTFYTDYQSVTPDIMYLVNLGNPFEHAEWDGGRWGVLAGWISNADVKNAGGDQYGGYELRGGTGVLSFEAGWGLRAVPNGKIYQVTTLPAGKYVFKPTVSERGSAGVIYAAVVKGTAFPDFPDVTTQSIAYALQTSAGEAVEFELTEATQVAIGFVADMPDTGSYFKVSSVSFKKIE